jgi:hypothetical protein
MMQEHRSLIKRASAWSKEKTAGECQHSNFEIFFIFGAPNINALV